LSKENLFAFPLRTFFLLAARLFIFQPQGNRVSVAYFSNAGGDVRFFQYSAKRSKGLSSTFIRMMSSRQHTPDKFRVIVFHGQVHIDEDAAPRESRFFLRLFVQTLSFKRFPIQTDAAFLPIREVVEVDSVLEEKFVFRGHRFSQQKLRRLGGSFSLMSLEPITVSVQRVPRRVFVSPAEIIHHESFIRQFGYPAIEAGEIAKEQRKFRAGFAREYRSELAGLSLEGAFAFVKEKRYLVAFCESVKHFEAAVHEVFDGFRHHVPEPRIERRFEFMDLLREAREIPAVYPRNYVYFWRDDAIL
jgi:hypothetical protein